jgi:hypothetical protein
MKPGCEASREATGFGRCLQRDDPSRGGCTTQNVTDKGHCPGVLWTPEGIGRCPQRDNPSCASGTTQHFTNEGYDPEEFGRNRQEGDAPCESDTAQGKLRREKPAQGNRHQREPRQGQGRARNPKNVGA